MITVDNKSAWNEYVKAHKDASCFRFKLIPNWVDIVDLCAKDRATGHGAEIVVDANDIMSLEQKNGKISEECEIDCSTDYQGLEELNIESQSGASHPTHAQRKRDNQQLLQPHHLKRKELEIRMD